MDVYGLSSPDLLRIDDLLDLSNEEIFSSSSTVTSSAASTENPFKSNYFHASPPPPLITDFTHDLCVPIASLSLRGNQTMVLLDTSEPFPALEDQKAFTDRTSPEPSGQFCNANTGVFWDVRDYRIPDLFDPDLVKQKITEAVLDAGYTGDVSIRLWIAKNKHSDHLLQLYSAAKIPITFLPKDDELEMIHNIVVGILLWSLDDPGPANVMVVSEHISYDMLESLQILRNKDYRVLLSSPPQEWDTDIFPCGSLDWLLKSLSPPNKKKRPIADISDSEDSDNSAYLRGVNPSTMTSETMWSEFPCAPAGCGSKIYLLVEIICGLDFI